MNVKPFGPRKWAILVDQIPRRPADTVENFWDPTRFPTQ